MFAFRNASTHQLSNDVLRCSEFEIITRKKSKKRKYQHWDSNVRPADRTERSDNKIEAKLRLVIFPSVCVAVVHQIENFLLRTA
jgi:hypothetical protein